MKILGTIILLIPWTTGWMHMITCPAEIIIWRYWIL